MVLPCFEIKRFEESMFSCTLLLQQTAAMLQPQTIFWRRSWKQKLQVWYLCIVMRTASLRSVAILLNRPVATEGEFGGSALPKFLLCSPKFCCAQKNLF